MSRPRPSRLLPAEERIRWSRRLEELLALPAAAALRGRARRGGPPRLSYGVGRVKGGDEIAHGGQVKVQLLQAEFPGRGDAFNLLYLVSSALPRGAALLARAAAAGGARLVLNQDGVAYPGWHGPGWEATNELLAGVLRRADHVLYQSDFCRRAADRFLGSARAGEVLHNAVDTTAFAPGEARLAERPLTLLLAGNQDQRYRVETALRALERLRAGGIEARLLVTGRLGWGPADSTAAQVRSLARELGAAEHVEWLGPYTQREAPALYRRAHLLLHTKYNDPCPGVVIEAMACGLPVVHSRSGGTPELVGEEAGIGVPAVESFEADQPSSPEALASAVAAAAGRLGELSAAARRRALARFDLGPWLARHRALFAELLARA